MAGKASCTLCDVDIILRNESILITPGIANLKLGRDKFEVSEVLRAAGERSISKPASATDAPAIDSSRDTPLYALSDASSLLLATSEGMTESSISPEAPPPTASTEFTDPLRVRLVLIVASEDMEASCRALIRGKNRSQLDSRLDVWAEIARAFNSSAFRPESFLNHARSDFGPARPSA
eukprot:scaffold922_cov327-Pinguiococcus_pyrenoidosus.AAC.28